ncbi:uncharacterized protein LOC126950817 [Macaca thibetana thibetana]|uniref:uncharacterized protein LOC126950817 n=1 Tax=Macaca thibetana thibetana TaxID=257877 RepID=UPI0021BC8823|nr:uncharacterized protein LOC126950817 [Macaca thibetana thibetana]
MIFLITRSKDIFLCVVLLNLPVTTDTDDHSFFEILSSLRVYIIDDPPLLEKEENVWGRLGFREAEGGGGRPGHCDFLVRCLWEEDGPEVLKGPFQPPTTNAGGGVGEIRKQPRRDKSLMLPVELDRAVNKPGQLWRQVGAPVGSTVAEAALPPPSPPPPPRPLRYWGKRCRCDRGGRGWSSRRLQRAGAAEPCLDAQSRH